MDVAQALEDVLEDLAGIQKDVNKLKTASVSGQALRKRVKDTHKSWLPVAGVLEAGTIVDTTQLQDVSAAWTALVKLANSASQKKQYKALLKIIITKTESELLHVPGTSAVHTASDIPLSAYGVGSSMFSGVMDNTDVFFKVMQAALGGTRIKAETLW